MRPHVLLEITLNQSQVNISSVCRRYSHNKQESTENQHISKTIWALRKYKQNHNIYYAEGNISYQNMK